MFGFPRSGMPTLKDEGDRFCLNTLYDRPLKLSGYVIDAVGNVRFYGDSVLGGVVIPLNGRVTGITRLTMSGYITGVTDLTMSGNLLITSGEIGNTLQRVKNGWFKNLDVKNSITVDGDPVALIGDLSRINQRLQATVDALSDYELLAVPITSAEFFGLISNSGLKPSQWYLITNYQNETPIANTNPVEYTVGAVEQIYILATSINEIHPEGISKTYPDEKVTIKQTVPAIQSTHNWYEYGGQFGIEIDGGVNYRPTTALTVIDANSAILSIPADTLAEIQADILDGFTFYIALDDYNGGSATLESTNYGIDWELNGDVVSFINGGAYYGALSFSDCINNGFVGAGCATAFSQLSDYYPNLYFVPLSSTTAELRGDNVALFNEAYGDFTINFNDYVAGESENFTPANKGSLWDYDPDTHLISYYGSLIDFESLRYNGECLCNFQVAEKLFPYGRIVSRKNERLVTYIEADYRSKLHARYKINATDFTVGVTTATAGTVYRYAGNLFLCVLSGNPVANIPAWNNTYFMQLGTDGYVMPDSSISLKSGYAIVPDTTSRYDFPMFDTALFDAIETPIYLTIKAVQNQETANVVIGTIGNNFMESTISVNDSTILKTSFKNNNIVLEKCLLLSTGEAVRNSIFYMEHVVVNSTFSDNKFNSLKSSTLFNFTLNNGSSIEYVIQSYLFTKNSVTYLANSIFIGYTSNNNFIYCNNSSFLKAGITEGSPCCLGNYFVSLGASGQNTWNGYCQKSYFYGATNNNTFANMTSCSFYSTVSGNNCSVDSGIISACTFYSYFQNSTGDVRLLNVTAFGMFGSSPNTFGTVTPSQISDVVFYGVCSGNAFTSCGIQRTLFMSDFSSNTLNTGSNSIGIIGSLFVHKYRNKTFGTGIGLVNARIYYDDEITETITADKATALSSSNTFRGLNICSVNKSTNYTVLSAESSSVLTDVSVYMDATGGNRIISLPPSYGQGRYIICMKVDSSANTVTVSANTGGTADLINGTATYVLRKQYEYVVLHDYVADKWGIIADNQLKNEIFVDPDGNVGIGDNAPSEKLDVNGNVKATGYKSSDGSAGITTQLLYLDDNSDVHTMHIKNGLIVGIDI